MGHLGLFVLLRFSFYFKFCMLLMRVSHSKTSCCDVLKWRFLICQSICELCKVSQNTRFFGDEMTLKTTLLVWKLMVTSNALVSCVINPDEKLESSMTSTSSNVFFSIKANLYYHTSSLSMKHANVLESRSAWVSIVTSLLHLIMIGTKKRGVGS